MLGNGILLSDGDFHRRQRLLMQPAFHHSNMLKYVDIMRSSAAAVYDSWSDGQQVGIMPTATALARARFDGWTRLTRTPPRPGSARPSTPTPSPAPAGYDGARPGRRTRW